MTTCKHCGAEALWGVTNNGRRTLLDAEPTTDGTTILLEIGSKETAITVNGEVRDAAIQAGFELRTVHFLTCENKPERNGG